MIPAAIAAPNREVQRIAMIERYLALSKNFKKQRAAIIQHPPLGASGVRLAQPCGIESTP